MNGATHSKLLVLAAVLFCGCSRKPLTDNLIAVNNFDHEPVQKVVVKYENREVEFLMRNSAGKALDTVIKPLSFAGDAPVELKILVYYDGVSEPKTHVKRVRPSTVKESRVSLDIKKDSGLVVSTSSE